MEHAHEIAYLDTRRKFELTDGFIRGLFMEFRGKDMTDKPYMRSLLRQLTGVPGFEIGDDRETVE